MNVTRTIRSFARIVAALLLVARDGQVVAFASSAPNLVPGDTNGRLDVFVHDRRTQKTTRVSVDSAGVEGDDNSRYPALSADGQVVAFNSAATNLDPGDVNQRYDVFAHVQLDAAWTNYGAGFAGTNGIPAFTMKGTPMIGSTVTIDLANSLGSMTPGLVLLGFQRIQVRLRWDGDLLVLPLSDALVGVAIDLQALELDPGATKGVSFTAGLEFTIGH